MQRALLAKCQKGLATLEFALVAPVLISLGLGGIEIANNLSVRKEINEVARMVADNAARAGDGNAIISTAVGESDINDLFLGAALQAQEIDLEKKGRIILSSLEQNAQGGQWIHWQRCFGAARAKSAYPAGSGRTGRGFAGVVYKGNTIRAAPQDAVMIVEVAYDYTPVIGLEVLGYGTTRITTMAAMTVRDRRDLTGLSADEPAASCS